MDFLIVDTTHGVEALVVLGVDTPHADAHVAVALDGLGRRLGSKTVSATDAGATQSSSPGPKASGGWTESG
jgi:hypothetical protein